MKHSPQLAPFAVCEANAKGRQIDEPAPKYRGEYQRDRDRIIHSTAFRRLMYKTQVFVNHEGDMYRTRLTHSLEVAQVGRTVARALNLNEDLTEAVSLAHDLGHTPFGHAGQDALNECMRDYGGFEHNLQSLRVVDHLETRYARFAGLNLCFETREGILKHCSLRYARELGEIGARFIKRKQPSLEAQLANIADEIAYNNHDVDDGLRAGLITLAQLDEIPFFAERRRWVMSQHGALEEKLLGREVVREMIDRLVTDLLENSRKALIEEAPSSVDDVRNHDRPLIGCSAEFAEIQRTLKSFLREHLYAHPHVKQMTAQAHSTIKTLFAMFMNDYSRMPDKYADMAQASNSTPGANGAARVVADYIAGMTDRFALAAVC